LKIIARTQNPLSSEDEIIQMFEWQNQPLKSQLS